MEFMALADQLFSVVEDRGFQKSDKLHQPRMHDTKLVLFFRLCLTVVI